MILKIKSKNNNNKIDKINLLEKQIITNDKNE